MNSQAYDEGSIPFIRSNLLKELAVTRQAPLTSYGNYTEKLCTNFGTLPWTFCAAIGCESRIPLPASNDAVGGLFRAGAFEDQLCAEFLFPPDDLVQELGNIVRTRRPPALAEALWFGALVLEDASEHTTNLLADSIRTGLQYLVTEASYGATNSSFAAYEIPQMRQLAARAAAALAKKIGTDDQTVRLWIKEIAQEPLSTVRASAERAFHDKAG